jgi:hypothetical protein
VTWRIILDTAEPLPPPADESRTVKAGEPFAVESRALTLLRREP